MLKKHKILWCIFFLLNELVAQEIKFSHITAEQGLSMGTVNCILRDSHGFMWFGTQDGLNKYDGYSISIFKNNPTDSNSISNNFIHALYEDKEGILWIGTAEGGVDAFNLNTGKIKHYSFDKSKSNSIGNNSVRAIVEDADGIIWLGTDDGLNAINKKINKITRYKHEENHPYSLPNNFIWTLKLSVSGTLWIGTKGGLCSFDKKNGGFTTYINKINQSIVDLYDNSNKIRDILELENGNILLGTDGAGVYTFDVKSEKYIESLFPISSNPVNNRITCISKDKLESLWIGTYGGGLMQYSFSTKKTRIIIAEENSKYALNNNKIKTLFHDNIGSVWVGTEGGGVNVHFRASNKFKHYKTINNNQNALKSNVILSLFEDDEKLLWIGTNQGGISTLNRNTDEYKHYPELSPSSNNSVLSIFQDKDGLMWIGTWGRGLLSYDKKSKTKKSYSVFENAVNATIVCITQAIDNKIWVGTYEGGLFSIDKLKNEIKNYTTENNLSSNHIYTIKQDSKGLLWIGTDGGGVNVLNPNTGEVKKYEKNQNTNSISSNTINHIYEDRSNNMWFATTNGLNKLDVKTQTFQQYYEKDGLPNDYIYCILTDSKGNLWMTTNKGISKFNPLASDASLMFWNYDVNDGLQGMEHNQGAFYKSKSGEMFVGGINGFNIFTPEKIVDNTIPPPVKIISYKRFGTEIPLDTLIYNKKILELSWRENFFSFDFAALDYQMPGKNKYSYKLQGVDKDWSPPGTQKYVSYTELKGGEYIFKVKASNSEGIWNEDGVMIKIIIYPPFWQTTWFYVSVVIIILLSFWGYIRYRTKSILRENKILEEKVAERTNELAQKNNDITSSIQYAKRIQLAILPPLEQIYKQFKEAFVFYKPKDIVSGDFYWFGIKNEKQIIALVDCTGHGVPGAFMSMIGYNILNQIILENGVTQPDLILNALHNGVQSALKQGTNVVDTSDGMDIALCMIDIKSGELQYAGAHRPIYIIRENELTKVEPNKFSIGGASLDVERKFTNHKLKINSGDTVYMYSDGFADQFGGEKGKKFMVKQLNQLLLSIYSKPMLEQANTIENTLTQWKGNYQQVDDILIIGLRF